jgi:hypothetical protein
MSCRIHLGIAPLQVESFDAQASLLGGLDLVGEGLFLFSVDFRFDARLTLFLGFDFLFAQ